MHHGAYLGMLRTFLCVYRCGGVAKAAGQLGLSQPAVSRHLKTLEDIMERTLFDRLGRGVAPTQAGVLLAAQIAAHLDAWKARSTRCPRSAPPHPYCWGRRAICSRSMSCPN